MTFWILCCAYEASLCRLGTPESDAVNERYDHETGAFAYQQRLLNALARVKL